MNNIYSPRDIVAELDRFIIGQHDAKRAVAIALRNRWRRQKLNSPMKEEIVPKNILMIGPTGVGKTEISRRLAKLAGAPFVKVEATKFTEIGFVGRDVEQIIRDLVEVSVNLIKEKKRKEVNITARINAEERVISALFRKDKSKTREELRQILREGKLDKEEIEIEISDNSSSFPSFDIPGMPGTQMGILNISEIFGKLTNRKRTRKIAVKNSFKILVDDESDKLLDQDQIFNEALKVAENEGIVFIDEIDKIAIKKSHNHPTPREGVQRDLLPLVEGTTVATKYGQVKTDHILFIASGAFHISKPSDLLPELQGRLPIRVELHKLTKEDFKSILTEPEASLIKQYIALMSTEDITLKFTNEAIDALADIAVELNSNIENIGARRLQTVMERVLDEISYNASEKKGKVEITDKYVRHAVKDIVSNIDLSRYIL